MSDPAKTNEIEDVLSSIRRLVSENAKAAHDRDALVLTQDHRVSQVLPQPTAPKPAAAQVSPAAPSAMPVAPAVSASQMSTSTTDQTAAAVRSEPVLTRRAETVEARTPPIAAAPVGQTAAPAFNRVQPKPASTERTGPKLSLGRPPVAPVAATQDIPPAPPSLEPQLTSEAEEQLIDAAQTAVLEETISTLETTVAGQEADWEPDDVFPTENDPMPIPPQAEPVIDEEAIRQLVVDTVREELRGDLGEKITRNVRKLVRREIQRALTAQGLE